MRRWKPYASYGRWFALVLAVVFTAGTVAFTVLTSRHFRGEAMAWDINMTFYAQLIVLCIMVLCAILSWLRFCRFPRCGMALTVTQSTSHLSGTQKSYRSIKFGALILGCKCSASRSDSSKVLVRIGGRSER